MERLQSSPSALLLLSLFLSLNLLSSAEITGFVSCLASEGVKNVTLLPQDEKDAGAYYHLLNFSIQNPRFGAPKFAKPVAIVLPRSVEQLSGTILCVRQQLSWAIRIRSGGHSYEGLSSVADETPFVIIDLMNLNRVSVDVTSQTAWVEAGATLGEVYYAIAESSDSLGFSAGSCPTVGSGGHIGGGGFGLLSRKFGLAADNVVDAILVDSEGRVFSREGMGEDVFWAIRGGGGGTWGAVYAWKIKLLPVPKRVSAFVVSRPGLNDRVAELVHKWQFVAPKLPDDFYLSSFIGALLPEAQTIGMSATFKGFYLGPKAKLVSILKWVFPELAIEEADCTEMSWIESIFFFSNLKSGSTVDDLKDRVLHDKVYFKAKSDYARDTIPLHVIKSMIEILSKEPKGYIIMDPYGGFMERVSNDSIPFPHRSGNLYSFQYLVSWNEKDNWRSQKLIEWLEGFYNYMTSFVSKGPRAAYVNYLDLDLGEMRCRDGKQNSVNVARAWGEKYFLGNYDRLVRVKTLIDPSNAFCNPQSIPPLTWDGSHSVLYVI
ncbi:berberine bridge enzyme-like D-2 [Aristolochia californica]|uniref:berberine bridge enzyme-like D-2 n=1 Tax=Aristolochia californica TaxID=171875 RepID=UPI0035E260DE